MAGALLWAGAAPALEGGGSAPSAESTARPALPSGHLVLSTTLMGVPCSIETFDPDSARVPAVRAALAAMAATEEMLSDSHRQSQVVAFNGQQGRRFLATPDFYAVVDSSLAIARLTRGAFDPTIGAITRAWTQQAGAPSDSALGEATLRVGWQLLDLHRISWSVTFGVEGGGMDLGAIARGAILDRAVAALADSGVRTARIRIGSQVRVVSHDHPWPIEFADGTRAAPFATLVAAQGAVCTNFDPDRTIYDPATGRPVVTDARVAVFAASGVRADALCSALLVMGRERARAFTKDHPEIGVIWVEPSGPAPRGWIWGLQPTATDPRIQWVAE
jgi:thiamine biosynthesis lipoprotein